MNSEILSIGTELLMGQIANTNAMFISKKLNEIGVNVYYHSVVGDNPKRVIEALKIALNRADVIVVTGGLGPTDDDLTKEVISKELGRELIFNDYAYNVITDYFERNHKEMTSNNKKQAYMPKDSIIIPNKVGTACGCIIENDNKIVIMLPGPPIELNPMVIDTVIPYLEKKTNKIIKSKFIKIFGLGEAQVSDKIEDLIESQTDPTIATYCELGEVLIRLTTSGDKQKDFNKVLSDTEQKIKERLDEYIYSTNGEDLQQVVVNSLKEKKKTISCAESCTGGMLSAKITDVSGASEVFNRGIVTYTNIAKMENLGVPKETLDKFGAVSKETAKFMAEGVRRVSKTDIGVSVTGIAGPTGGTKEKPVGLVYIALANETETFVKELRLDGNRQKIRELTCKNVLDMVRRELTK